MYKTLKAFCRCHCGYNQDQIKTVLIFLQSRILGCFFQNWVFIPFFLMHKTFKCVKSASFSYEKYLSKNLKYNTSVESQDSPSKPLISVFHENVMAIIFCGHKLFMVWDWEDKFSYKPPTLWERVIWSAHENRALIWFITDNKLIPSEWKLSPDSE